MSLKALAVAILLVVGVVMVSSAAYAAFASSKQTPVCGAIIELSANTCPQFQNSTATSGTVSLSPQPNYTAGSYSSNGVALKFNFLMDPATAPQIESAIVKALQSSADPRTQVEDLASSLAKISKVCSPATCPVDAALFLSQATQGTSLANPQYATIANDLLKQAQDQAAGMSVTQQQQTFGYVVRCVNYAVYDYYVNLPSGRQNVLLGTGTSKDPGFTVYWGPQPPYSGQSGDATSIINVENAPPPSWAPSDQFTLLPVISRLDTGLTCPSVAAQSLFGIGIFFSLVSFPSSSFSLAASIDPFLAVGIIGAVLIAAGVIVWRKWD